MYGLKYTIYFSSVRNVSHRVELWQEGYSGEVTELEAGESPIIVSEDDSENVLMPCRAWTGQMNLLDNTGNELQDFRPMYIKEYRVLVYREDVLEWRGYVKPESLTQNWEEAPYTIAYNLVSPLGALESELMDQTKPMLSQSLGSLIKEIVVASGYEYERIYIPLSLMAVDKVGNADQRKLWTDVRISRFAFFAESDAENISDVDYERYDAESYMSCLETICRFFGLTAREDEKNLYLIDPEWPNYGYISEDAIDTSGEWDGNASMDNQSITADMIDGNTNRIDLLPGYNRVKVIAKIKGVGNVLPKLTSNSFVSKSRADGESQYIKIKGVYYDLTSLDGLTQFYMYSLVSMQNKGYTFRQITKWEDMDQSQSVIYNGGGVFCRIDRYLKSEEEKDKTSYDFNEYICFQPNVEFFYPMSKGDARPYPIVQMKAAESAIFDSGALSINADFVGAGAGWMNMFEDAQTWSCAGQQPEFRLRIGDKYWDGEKWSLDEATFRVDIVDGTEDNSGKRGYIKTTKTLLDPYNGLKGYMIPISETLEGEVELTLYQWFVPINDGYAKIAPIYISNLELGYTACNVGDVAREKTENKYVRKLDNKYGTSMDDYVVELFTDNGNPASYNKLMYGGDPLVSIISMKENNQVGEGRPEELLLGKLGRLNGRPTELLTLELDYGLIGCMSRVDIDGGKWWPISVSKDMGYEHATVRLAKIK